SWCDRLTNIYIELYSVGNISFKIMREYLLRFFLFFVNKTGYSIIYTGDTFFVFFAVMIDHIYLRIQCGKIAGYILFQRRDHIAQVIEYIYYLSLQEIIYLYLIF